MVTRLTLRSFKHKKRKVTIIKFWTQKKYSVIHVCAFLCMQSFRIGLILVLEGGVVFRYSRLKCFLGQLIYILTFYFSNFV